MVGCMGVLDNARRGPKTGGDVVRGHIAQAAGGEDPYVFSYRRLDVHAYVLPEPVPHVLSASVNCVPVPDVAPLRSVV